MPDAAPALTPEQLCALQAAQLAARKITRAAGVAAFSGWSLVTFAVLTLLGGLFSLPTFLLGVGMAISGRIELRGAKSLRRYDRTAPRRLGLNQIALGAMFTAYGAWGIVAAVFGPGHYDEQIAAGGQVAEMLEPIAAMHTMASVAVSAGVIVGALFATGCASLYYFTRRGHIDAHIERTPEWVIDAMRVVH